MSHELKYTREEAIRLLKAEGEELKGLYREADFIRRQNMGDDVFIRGIVEFSNVCSNDCLYCGIRASNKNVRRYAMGVNEILDTAIEMEGSQQTTIVLQSGETPGIKDEEIAEIIKRIKRETTLTVTISAGNRPCDTYRYWRECGMERYFLRFETSDPVLFDKLHPGSTLAERLQCLNDLQALGIQTGSGFMIGLPGETLEILADNILLCRKLDLDMIGIGPYISHPETPLGKERNIYDGNPEIFYKAVAVLRIFNPDAHIPATTAFDAVFPGEGRNLVLQRGANVFMPNNTPSAYRKDYLLYPGKPGVDESPDQNLNAAVLRIESLGRIVGKGPGHSIKKRKCYKSN
jgi:biotin synthase